MVFARALIGACNLLFFWVAKPGIRVRRSCSRCSARARETAAGLPTSPSRSRSRSRYVQRGAVPPRGPIYYRTHHHGPLSYVTYRLPVSHALGVSIMAPCHPARHCTTLPCHCAAPRTAIIRLEIVTSLTAHLPSNATPALGRSHPIYIPVNAPSPVSRPCVRARALSEPLCETCADLCLDC